MDLSSNSSQVNLLSLAFFKHLLTAIQILYHHHCTITQLPTLQGSHTIPSSVSCFGQTSWPKLCLFVSFCGKKQKNDWFFGLFFFGGGWEKWDPAIFSPRFKKKTPLNIRIGIKKHVVVHRPLHPFSEVRYCIYFRQCVSRNIWTSNHGCFFKMRLLKNAEHQGLNALVVQFHRLLPNLPPFDPILLIFDRQRCFNMFSSSKTRALFVPTNQRVQWLSFFCPSLKLQ